MTSERRITLVSSADAVRPWDVSETAPTRVIPIRAFNVLRYALENGVQDLGKDVERVVVDRTASAVEMLDLLTQMPVEFNGDLLYIREDQSGYLSAKGRGGDRVLYSLQPRDVQFYLQTHGLLAEEKTAISLAA
jgi:hypothetical protein